MPTIINCINNYWNYNNTTIEFCIDIIQRHSYTPNTQNVWFSKVYQQFMIVLLDCTYINICFIYIKAILRTGFNWKISNPVCFTWRLDFIP